MPYAYFTEDAQLRHYLPTTVDVKLYLMQTYIDRAVDQLARPIVGLPLLESFETTPPPEALLKKLRAALASYAYKLYTPAGSLLLTSNGAAQYASETQKVATDKQVERATNALEHDGYAQMEAVLDYLELHANDFPAWRDSTYTTIFSGHFLRTATEFERYVLIDGSRRTFRSFWPALLAFELHQLGPVLGRPLRIRLLAEIDDPEHAEVLEMIRLALANMCFPADDLKVVTAASSLDELLQHLHEHTSDYPEFLDSPSYQPTPERLDQSDFGFYAFLPY